MTVDQVALTIDYGFTAGVNLNLVIALILAAGMMLSACGGTQPNHENVAVDADELSVTISGLNPGTTYFWKVMAVDSQGNITESEVRSFTTQ